MLLLLSTTRPELLPLQKLSRQDGTLQLSSQDTPWKLLLKLQSSPWLAASATGSPPVHTMFALLMPLLLLLLLPPPCMFTTHTDAAEHAVLAASSSRASNTALHGLVGISRGASLLLCCC
jgi:hypothetical protein